jgi:phosphatidate cytidylyltransferase
METRLIMIVGALFAFGALLMTLSHSLRKPESSQASADWKKYGVYLILVVSLLLLASWSRWLIASLCLTIALGGAVELYRNLPNGKVLSHTISLVFLFVITLFLGHLLLGEAEIWFSSFAFIFLMVSVTDSYSQLWGKLLGNYKLCPRLSPGKTTEGLLGGLVSVAAVSSILHFLLPQATFLQLIGLAMITAASAIGGDLLFSLIKRRIGIKDFSGILPGHGGILDRFDSLIVAAPVYYWSKFLIFN